ncbi:MAG TPA: hypothetical protein PLR07_09870 [Promineifilum sp.]|nr:hypothetical protein [Promineifilum sp.]
MSQRDEDLEFRLAWALNTDIHTIYANHFFISHAGGEFYLTFGELVPPVTPNESADDLRKRVGDTLEIMPLVRLAITPEVMIKIAEAVRTNITTYISITTNEEAEQ